VPEGDSIFRLAAKLRPWLVGQVLSRVDFPRKALSPERLQGKRVTAVDAIGKNLLVRVEDGTTLHVHLRMLGRVRLSGVSRPEPRWAAASFVLETEKARVVGTDVPVVRVLDAAQLRRDPALRALGPDPLHDGFDVETALAGLRARGALGIGEALLDQRAIAGLGNVYKSEVLFRRKLDPFTKVRDVDAATLRALVDDAAALLRWNAERQARGSRERITRTAGPRSPTGQSVYGRARRPCFDCGTPIRAADQGGRTTYWCPTCQPARK
jgi:endonuclease-8